MATSFFKNTPLKTSLRKQFNGCPPFSILNAREGYWQKRKRQWIKLGIQSELGRGEMNPGSPGDKRHDPAATMQKKYTDASKKLAPGRSPLPAADYSKSGARGDGRGKAMKGTKKKGKGLVQSTGQDLMRGEHKIKGYGSEKTNAKYNEQVTGTSIFDPVLTELMYNWFCPKEGHILDPFAGGSVRGIVAGVLNRDYTGIDLSKNQIAANRAQVKIIQPVKSPTWIIGESFNVMAKQLGTEKYDFIFTCPPYHDLEVYSEHPNDLSNMDYSDFVIAYSKIIKRAVYLLKENRFACFVVGEIRAKDGSYKGFVSDTIRACVSAGLKYYNEAILITAVGSLPIRIVKQFKSGLKLGKTHQNILIFYKGDVSKVKDRYEK